MASVKSQLEELKKPNPRIVLWPQTIRGMTQEADNMDKRLRAVIQRTQAHQMLPCGILSAPQPPPPIPTVSTPTPQAATPGITAPCPQIPKSPKGKAPARHKGPTKANNVETPTPAHTVASTPTSLTHVDAKGGGKRVRDDDIDAPTSGVSSASPPKRVKSN